MVGDRCGNDQLILTEWKKDAGLIACILPDQSEIYRSVKDTVDGFGAVCLNENRYPGVFCRRLPGFQEAGKRTG